MNDGKTDLDQGLKRLNSLSPCQAQAEFLKCCGSSEWARRMTQTRPFNSLDELLQKADRLWSSLRPEDWLEAFHSHPKIGETKAHNQPSAVAQRWSQQEQSGVGAAAPDTLESLADLNRRYQEKFGYIFIVCATGKSADQMLSLLVQRLGNEAGEELRIAANEQAAITKLRLEKLLNQ